MTARPTLFDPERARRDAARLARRDPLCRRLADLYGPARLRPRRPGGAFAYLVRVVLYQQLALPAAAAIHERLAARLGGRPPDAASLLRLGESGLRECGVSRPKARALLALAEAVASGELRPRGLARLSDEEIERRLVAIPGIGPWSAAIFMLFHLGRRDVFPATDLGLRAAAAMLAGEKEPWSPARLASRAEAWRPCRSTAAWWLWRHRSGTIPGLR
ncbi:MAG: DNA-3-methyladenine glycosylase 2 family protein [Acidobacteria bacterium]|nr:MAG: DNA-3-methyladenine glycosylase 2 family protein [Acidobacteriota bacterium]